MVKRKGGWYGNKKGHRDAGIKGAKDRKKRVKGKAVLTNEKYVFRVIRDSKTGEIKGKKFVRKIK